MDGSCNIQWKALNKELYPLAEHHIFVGCRKNCQSHLPAEACGRLSDEYGASIHIEDLAGDEAGVFRAEEQDGGGNLLRRANASEGDGATDFIAAVRVIERRLGHVGVDPTGGHGVHVDAVVC